MSGLQPTYKGLPYARPVPIYDMFYPLQGAIKNHETTIGLNIRRKGGIKSGQANPWVGH